MITNEQKAKIVTKFLKKRIKESKREFRESKKGDWGNFPLAVHIELMEEWISIMNEHKGGYYF